MDKDRKQTEYDIVRVILSALDNDKITFREAQAASKYFLLHFDGSTDAISFLNDANAKWKIFDFLIEKYKKESQYSIEDATKLEKIKQQLSQLTHV